MSGALFRLTRAAFGELERVAVEADGLTASLFRYPTGVEAIRLSNDRGHLIVLPYLGQMVWQAVFDGVDLTMRNMFAAPRSAREIAETYGCFAFHSGLLRNGVPGPDDSHAAHGEMACAPMDEAAIRVGSDGEGPFMRIEGAFEYAMGFGAHYRARPSVTLRPGSGLFDMAMALENLSGAPMDLMYMCHANFAYPEGGRIVQPANFSPEQTRVRHAVPAHVVPTPDYRAFIEELAADPSPSARLDAPGRYDPEQVFYLSGLGRDADGRTELMLQRSEGDGFSVAYDPDVFTKTVRWILVNCDQAVCAFALPSTCEPEGYTAERAKGNVRRLEGGGTAAFAVRLGYLAAPEAEAAERRIAAMKGH